MERIETARLILRPWREDDLADLFEYARDPRVGPAAGWAVHETMDDSRKILAWFIGDDEVLAIALKETGKVIGSIGVHRCEEKELPVRELGYVLNPAYWGVGYAPEAAIACIQHGFEVMGLEEIRCCHVEGNDASRRIVEKCGFTYLSQIEREALGERRVERMYSLKR